MTPYRGKPAKAAVGYLASSTAYLMRFAAVCVDKEDVQDFIKTMLGRLRKDLLERNSNRPRQGKALFDFRYLLSLDDPSSRLIETPNQVVSESPPCVGKTYFNSGTIDAGVTSGKKRAARWIDETGVVRSVYSNGQNLLPNLNSQGVR